MRLAFVYSVEPTSPSRQSQQPHFRQSSCQNRSRAFNRNRSVIGFWQPEQSFCDCPIWLVAACTALDALTIEGVMAADEAVAEDWTSLTAATDEEDAKMMLTVFLWEPLTGNRRSPGPPKMRRFNVALKCLGMESAINWINNARYYSVAFSFLTAFVTFEYIGLHILALPLAIPRGWIIISVDEENGVRLGTGTEQLKVTSVRLLTTSGWLGKSSH